MTKTYKNVLKMFSGLLIVVLGLSACSALGLGDIASLKVAKDIQKNDSTLSSFTTGELILNSSISYYEANISEAEGVIADADSYDITPEELESIKAWNEISKMFVAKLPDTSDSSTDKVNAAYIGTANGSTVAGIFVYEFTDGIGIGADVAETANQLADLTGEYFFIKGNYIVTIESQFVSGNGINVDTVFAAAEAAIK